jgi:hypothetical protein
MMATYQLSEGVTLVCSVETAQKLARNLRLHRLRGEKPEKKTRRQIQRRRHKR